MNQEKVITDATRWLEQMVKTISHGEASIKVVIHAGQIKRVEKGLVEKEQANN
jgi:hypothetical protein